VKLNNGLCSQPQLRSLATAGCLLFPDHQGCWVCFCFAAGEKGIVPEGKEGAGKPYHLKGKPFYRIIDGFIDQAGEYLTALLVRRLHTK
jgi:hypothetical protein